jgi:small subunit ribosomal protein S21
LAEVRLQEGEPLENALRRFKRKVQTEDIIKEVKRHSYYLKPGEKRRVKQALARKRAKKKIRKDRDSRPDRDQRFRRLEMRGIGRSRNLIAYSTMALREPSKPKGMGAPLHLDGSVLLPAINHSVSHG